MAQDESVQFAVERRGKWGARLALIVAWAWTLVSGGGGVMLLIETGPWPLTNGWFAVCSGVAACPLTAWFANRILGIPLSGRARFVAAALIWLAGQIARRAGAA
jgi:hypothetical protein